jgi:phenylalanyl-tRNA synthetase beta chain
MKFSEAWLREWVNPALTREELSDRLTMTGLEIDSLDPVAEPFKGVVVGEILTVEKHPNADGLTVCTVNAKQAQHLNIVCGASNVQKGMKVPVALVGANLPNKPAIQEISMRGVTSQGMLCSSADIGLAEKSEGLLQLRDEAPLGQDFWQYLHLDDYIFDVAITPNRGDCLSILGMAREVSALTQTPLTETATAAIKPVTADAFDVEISAPDACTHYVGRVIRGVKAGAATPVWMEERLRRAGIRAVSAIVDVTNYVMLELGQPMHAFDLSQLHKKIQVRYAHEGEKLALLDGVTIDLNPETLIIADSQKPLAIAGVMGGVDSGISLHTQDIFLESAFFKPSIVARQRQMHQLHSESSYRFERGVDPKLQVKAIERATQLLIEMVGGEPGPLIDVGFEKDNMPSVVSFNPEIASSLLGAPNITHTDIEKILTRLGFSCKKEKTHWEVQIPTWRFDISEPVDLVEEVARLYGYDRIATTRPFFPVPAYAVKENQITLARIRRLFCDLGYHEVITYSFVNAEWQASLNPEKPAKALVNPITADMTVMRTNLWPGLLGAYLYNRDRQQLRGRFFETGLCFIPENESLLQIPMLGGLITGSALPEQWGSASRAVDFYDLKGDIETLLQLTGFETAEFQFKPINHPALHPGQTAGLYKNGELMGIAGAMHPLIQQKFNISETAFLFEVNLSAVLRASEPVFEEISKFPEIRRDLALLADRHLPVEEIQAVIVESGGEWLRQVVIFDVYLGEGVPKDKKSVAFALTLQHASRTLRDEEVAETMESIIKALKLTLGIDLRG